MTTSTSRPAAPARRRSRASLPVALGLAVLATAGAAGLLLPDLLGLDRFGTMIRLVSFRPQLLASAVPVLVLVLLLARRRRLLRPLAAGLLAVVLLGVAMVLPRAVADPDPDPASGRPLTVLGANVFQGRADPTALVALIRSNRPDLVSLPEAGPAFAARLDPLVRPLGYRVYVTDGVDRRDLSNLVALVSDRLGPVEVTPSDPSAPFPSVQVTGGVLGSLRFAAVHTEAPVRAIPRWKSDLAELHQWCAGPTPAIVAGDLNSTLDHSALRAGMAGCSDAASQRGDGLISTWGPTAGTRSLGPQIDHVLATDGITAQTFTVHDLPGSDHRAILTRLLLP